MSRGLFAAAQSGFPAALALLLLVSVTACGPPGPPPSPAEQAYQDASGHCSDDAYIDTETWADELLVDAGDAYGGLVIGLGQGTIDEHAYRRCMVELGY